MLLSLLLGAVAAVLALSPGIPPCLQAASSVVLIAIGLFCALSHLAWRAWRWRARAVSRAAGLRAIFLCPMPPEEVKRLYHLDLQGIDVVLELHVDTERDWRKEAGASDPDVAAAAFRRALMDDYRFVLGNLPAGYAFCVSTWHRGPREELRRLAQDGYPGVRFFVGLVAAWHPWMEAVQVPVYQRRMFGRSLLRPVWRRDRWWSFISAVRLELGR
jgi:hypothetical protein